MLFDCGDGWGILSPAVEAASAKDANEEAHHALWQHRPELRGQHFITAVKEVRNGEGSSDSATEAQA